MTITPEEIDERFAGSSNRVRHAVFTRLVLGESWAFALRNSSSYRDVALTLAGMKYIAEHWEKSE